MNPVPLFLIIVSLPLLLGGCGEKPKLEGVNLEELEVREGISYFKDTPYTGKSYQLWYNSNGQKQRERNYKDGKAIGLAVGWHKNGNMMSEKNWKDGEKISEKWWNSKGELVDSFEEARK